MDLNQISIKTAKQLSSFIETVLFFFQNPVLQFDPIDIKEKSSLIITTQTNKINKFNPSLFYYALICISLGSLLQASIPNMIEPLPIEKVLVLVVVLSVWIISALLITIPVKLLANQFYFKRVFSMVIQTLSTLYIVCSVLAFLTWIISSKTGTPFGFGEDMMSIWYYPFHIILASIYLPWSVLKITKTKGKKGVLLFVIIFVLLLIIESLSAIIWGLFHFAGAA